MLDCTAGPWLRQRFVAHLAIRAGCNGVDGRGCAGVLAPASTLPLNSAVQQNPAGETAVIVSSMRDTRKKNRKEYRKFYRNKHKSAVPMLLVARHRPRSDRGILAHISVGTRTPKGDHG